MSEKTSERCPTCDRAECGVFEAARAGHATPLAWWVAAEKDCRARAESSLRTRPAVDGDELARRCESFAKYHEEQARYRGLRDVFEAAAAQRDAYRARLMGTLGGHAAETEERDQTEHDLRARLRACEETVEQWEAAHGEWVRTTDEWGRRHRDATAKLQAAEAERDEARASVKYSNVRMLIADRDAAIARATAAEGRESALRTALGDLVAEVIRVDVSPDCGYGELYVAVVDWLEARGINMATPKCPGCGEPVDACKPDCAVDAEFYRRLQVELEKTEAALAAQAPTDATATTDQREGGGE